MMTLGDANRVVGNAASATLKDAGLIRAFTEDTVDPDGRDALRVVLVVDAENKITGDLALDVLVRIQQDLQRAGEARFAYVEYATEQDLAEELLEHDDAES